MAIAQNNNDNDSKGKAWENLCLSPYCNNQEDGRVRGRLDGMKSGYEEGYHIGTTTALSNGMEIGFIQGVLESLSNSCDLSTLLADQERIERAQKSIHYLQKAINEFPLPEMIIRHTETTNDVTPTQEGLAKSTGSDSESNHNDVINPATIDVSNQLQRIRARFKLLMVQLNISNVTLKQLMDHNAAGTTTTAAATTTTNRTSDTHDVTITTTTVHVNNPTSEW